LIYNILSSYWLANPRSLRQMGIYPQKFAQISSLT
jgi:hypothetical protein